MTSAGLGTLLVFYAAFLSSSEVNGQYEEKLLAKVLLQNYANVGKVGRPVASPNESITVHFGLDIMFTDEIKDNGMGFADVTITAWSKFTWNDVHLRWEPTDHAGLERLAMPIKDIWYPDIRLYKSLDIEPKQDFSTLALVHHRGNVTWVSPTKLRTRCPAAADGADFDWDCTFTFGSWIHKDSELNIDFFGGLEKADIRYYKDPVKIVKNTATKSSFTYEVEGSTDVYPNLKFTLGLKEGKRKLQCTGCVPNNEPPSAGISIVSIAISLILLWLHVETNTS